LKCYIKTLDQNNSFLDQSKASIVLGYLWFALSKTR